MKVWDGSQWVDTDDAGSILQVVQTTTSTSTSTTSVTHVDTALTGSITPSSSSSKILILASVAGMRNTNRNSASFLRLYRGDTSTGVALGDGDMGRQYFDNGSSGQNDGQSGIMFLDSPATTSAVTYTMGIRAGNVSNTATVYNHQGMILLEVAA